MAGCSLPPWIVVAVGLALSVTSAAGQIAPGAPGAPEVSADGTRTIYGEAFFAAFDPVSAEDIIKRIPGVQHLIKGGSTLPQNDDDEERRGFGSTGDQILLDGQRLAGKSNDIATALKNIQARQVARIEVIRGAVAGLDVRSEGLIVNIVLKQVAGSGSWEAHATHRTLGGVGWGGRISYASTLAGWKYTTAAQITPFYQLRARSETYVSPAGIPFEFQDEANKVDGTDYKLTLNTSTVTDGGVRIDLNGSYLEDGRPETLPTDRFSISGATPTFIGTLARTTTHSRDTWEVGGDVERALAGGSARVLFVANHTDLAVGTTFEATAVGQRTVTNSIQLEDHGKSERIVRGSYNREISPSLSAEAGAELAINTLEKAVSLTANQGGVLRPVALFNAQSRIRETRIEAFASVNWTVGDSTFVDGVLEYERSRLKQSGRDVNARRTLGYLKPRVDVRHDIDASTQIRLGVSRAVSQLDFADFVTTLEDDDNLPDVVNAGNPYLVPEKTWTAAATVERRLPNDGGLLSLRAYYDDITDHIEAIPVGDGSVSARGNLGLGREYGAEVKASLRMDGVGVAGGVIEASGVVRRTSVPDPFTGVRRRLQDEPDYTWSVRFRQDLDWRNLSYGLTAEDEAKRDQFELNYVNRFDRRMDLQAFVELQPFAGVTARIDATRLLRVTNYRERSTYVGNRGRNILLRRELRDIRFFREIRFSLRGTF